MALNKGVQQLHHDVRLTLILRVDALLWSLCLECFIAGQEVTFGDKKTDKVAINGEQEVEKNQSKPGWDPFLFINNPLLIADYPPASLWSMTRIGKRSSGFDFHRRTDFYQRSFEWL